MMLARLRTIAILMCLMVTSGLAFQSSPANRPWPPGVQKVSDESPVLSPADALKTFFMPPGYHLELVASEPLVQDPTVIDWDLNGRLWVVEMTAGECAWLFERICRLKGAGVGILYISHRQEEILELADRITVLRDGRCVWTGRRDAIDRAGLLRHMVGRGGGEGLRHRTNIRQSRQTREGGRARRAGW